MFVGLRRAATSEGQLAGLLLRNNAERAASQLSELPPTGR
jgi:hypothetical protein